MKLISTSLLICAKNTLGLPVSDGSPLAPYWGPTINNDHQIFENHVADHVHKGLKGKGLEVHSAVAAFTDEIQPQPAYRPQPQPSAYSIKHLADKNLKVLGSAELPPAWISALVENPAAQNPSEKYLEVILDKPIETPNSVTFFSGSKQPVQKETPTIVSTGAEPNGPGHHGHGIETGNPSLHDRFVPPEILLAEGSHWKTNGHLEHEKNQHYSGEVVPAQEG